MIVRFWEYVRTRYGPETDPEKDALLYWRELILFSLISIGLALSIFVLIPTLYMAVKDRLWGLAIFDSSIFFITLSLLISKRIKYEARATIVVFMLFATGVVVILSVGLLSGGPAWLFGFAVLAAALLGLKTALVAIMLNGVTLGTLGWLTSTGLIGTGHIFFISMERAVVAGFNFLLLNALAATIVAVLLKGLEELNRKTNLAVDEIRWERAQLLEAKEVLNAEIETRKQAEKHLKKSEERFRQMAELMPEIIFEMDTTTRLTFVNQNAYDLFRYTKEDFSEGLFAVDMLIPEERERAAEEIAKILQGHPPGLNEYTALRKDGTTFPIMIHASPIFNKGEPVGFRGFIVDITEKKKLEFQLRQAQKMEAIGTLAGGIAHDFNNILSAVLGYTELSMSVADEGSILHGNLLKIQKAGERARDLVRQILTFSRQSEQELVSIKVKPIVKEALKLLRASLPTTINIQTKIESERAIMGDPTQIHQVLMNLCTNAAHAMSQGGGVLEVELTDEMLDARFTRRHSELSEGMYVQLSVKDTGHGMSPDIAERIFNPFFTTKERGKGTGMGLSVVHGIVSSHGGVVTVDSTPGVGSTFHVYFPVTGTDPAYAKIEDIPLPVGDERILFIDDEAFQVDLGRQMLEKLGYTVVTQTDGREALNDFRNDPDKFDLVITDMTMPGLTGDELAGKIMTIRPNIPVILCTGYSEQITEDGARAMGIQEFIMKPVDMHKLSHAVRKVLDNRPVDR